MALNCQSSPLALQFLVQQRQSIGSIEQFPVVVQRSDSSCTAHPRSDPLKRTTKSGTRGKDSSKKNNKRKADKIIALRCELEGLKAEKSDSQQALRSAEIRAASAEGKAKKCSDKFHTLKQKAVERDLRAARARSKLCESTFLQESVVASALAPMGPSVNLYWPNLKMNYLNDISPHGARLGCQKLANELYLDLEVQAR